MCDVLNLEESMKDRHFAFLESDLDKLRSDDGCEIALEKVTRHNIDEESYSDDDEELGIELDCQREESKVHRMKREFLSVTLNANGDPIDPKIASELPDMFQIDTNGSDDPTEYDIFEFGKLDRGYDEVHRRYRKLGKFEDVIKKEENFFEPVFDSKLVLKRSFITGSGPEVTKNSIVIYNCALWNEGAKEPFDSTWLRHNTFVTDLSSDSILPGIHELILTMKTGEWAEAFIRPEAAFGELGAMPRIPPKATIFCLLQVIKVISRDKIELISYDSAKKQINGVSFEDLYTASDEARRRGNHYHSTKQYKVALQRYKSGIRILEALTYKDEYEEDRAKQLLVKLYNNAARSANNSNQSRYALGCCKQAYLLDKLNPKTHWNRVAAWKSLGHLDKALGAAKRAIQISVDVKVKKTFQREAENLQKELEMQQAKSDDLFRAMGQALAS